MFPTIPVFSAVVSQPFKRSQFGLFQGKTKQYGNNVPFSKHKTRRTWLPNVQRKRLFSDTLGEDVRVKLTTRALRTIKKHGGLDNYVAKTRSDILGWEGMRIRLMLQERNQKKIGVPESAILNKEDGLDTETPLVDTKIASKEAKREAVRDLRQIINGYPEWDSGREARARAMDALGLDSLPSPRRTIEYMKERRRRLHATLQSSG